MKSVNKNFKESINANGKQITSSFELLGVPYTDDLIVKINPYFDSVNSLLGTSMKCLEIEMQGIIPVVIDAKLTNLKFGVKDSGEYEYINFGTFIVNKYEWDIETNSTSLLCYDKMVESMIPYDLGIDYSNGDVTILNLLQKICDRLGWTLGTTNFTNSNIIIDEEKYDATYTFRSVLEEIGQVAGGKISFKDDDILYVIYPNETNEIIDESNLKTLTIGKKYGPVNSLVIARTPQEDNIYRQDNEMINAPSGDNMLIIRAKNSTVNGIKYVINENKLIHISGTASEKSTLNLTGSDGITTSLFTLKNTSEMQQNSPHNYIVFGLVNGVNIELYTNDGGNKTLIGSYKNNDVIIIEEDIEVTQVLLTVDKGVTIDATVIPSLALCDYMDYPVLHMQKYDEELFNLTKATSGYLADDTGEIVTGVNNEKTTDFISVNGKTFIICSLSVTIPTNGYIWWGYLFYDENETVLGTRQSIHNASNELKITIPTNAKYIRISTRFYSDGVLQIKDNRDGQYYLDGISTQETRNSKNLFNKLNYKIDNEVLAFDISKLIEGKTYTISSNKNIEKIKISNNRYSYNSVAINTTFTTYTFTMTRNSNISTDKTQYLFIDIINGSWVSDIAELSDYNIQIEEGTTANEFEEYGVFPSPESPSEIINTYKAGTYNAIVDKKMYTFTLPEDLRSVPHGVADRLWIDVDGDNGISIERKVGTRVINGSEYWYVNSTGINGHWAFHILNSSYGIKGNTLYYSDKFTSGYWDIESREKEQLMGATSVLVIVLSQNRITEHTTNALKNWLSTNNVKIQYELVTYTTSHIDDLNSSKVTPQGVIEVKIENNQLMDSHREDFIDNLFNRLKGLTFYTYELESYGIGYLELYDLFTIKTHDNNQHSCLFLYDNLEITQGLSENSKAELPEETETNYKVASESDRVLNKTILQVDKQDQEIRALITSTQNISGEIDGVKDNYNMLTQQIEQTMTATQVQTLITETISNGVDSVTTSTGYTFNKDGLRISKTGEEMENLLDNTGMYVNRDDENILTANNEGVNAINLTARQYLTIGNNSRLEDYKTNRTACFYIGGDN